MEHISFETKDHFKKPNRKITQLIITSLVKQIVEEFHPQKVVLFGSYAKGTAGKFSDLDLLIIMETDKSELQQAVVIRQFIKPEFAMDIIVRKPEILLKRISWGDMFLKDIITNGKVLYESPDA